MSRLLNQRTQAMQGALGAVALGLALVATPGSASAATVGPVDPAVNVRTTPSPAPATTRSPAATMLARGTAAPITTTAPATRAGSATSVPLNPMTQPARMVAVSPTCVPLTEGKFQHTFDPVTLTLSVEFLQRAGVAAGTALCAGGQAFTVAAWATQSTGYALPQRLLGTSQASVTVVGAVGRVVVTAPPTTGCAAQVDAYMAPASAVPSVLTGFSSGATRGAGAGGSAVNEPPLVGTPPAPYPSEGTTLGQQPYTLVGGAVCTLAATLNVSTSCTNGTVSGLLTVTNVNPWSVAYTAELDGTAVTASSLSSPDVAGGAKAAVPLGTLGQGSHTVTVRDANGTMSSTTTSVGSCAATTTVPPTTTALQPIVLGASTERTTTPATTPVAANTGAQVAGVVLTRTTTDKPTVFGAAGSRSSGSGGLASTGASVATPLGLGVAALLLGTGLLIAGRRKPRHAR